MLPDIGGQVEKASAPQCSHILYAVVDEVKNRVICGVVESLQSHMVLTMSHWSSGLTCLLPATRVTGSNPQGGTYVEPGFSC